jgi:fermentation-respiration switch protein FrsA (DUF1100 family)
MYELVTAAASVYIAANGALYVFQRRLVFAAMGRPCTPAEAGVPEMAEVPYRTEDGLALRAWYWSGGKGPTIVYFHGNAGHCAERAYKARFYIDRGYNFLLTSYRGYSGNPGRPSEAGVYRDARAALDFLAGEGIAPGRVVLYGESLGTGIAVQMAAERRMAALVLEAPFTSLVDVASRHYWWTPARWLVRDRFESLAKIGAIAMPLLVVHGQRDRTVPVSFGKRLFAAAPEPKELRLLPRAGHADVYDHGAGEAVDAFLRALS